MPAEFRIDKEEGIVYGILRGEVDVDQVLAGLTEIISSEDFKPGLSGITDLRSMSWESDQEDLRRLIQFILEHKDRIGQSRSAIVVAGDREYGMSRMFEVYSDESPLDVRVFRDFDEAKRWIMSTVDEEE